MKDFKSGEEKVYWVSSLEYSSWLSLPFTDLGLFYNSVNYGKQIMQMILVYRNANKLCLVEYNLFWTHFCI